MFCRHFAIVLTLVLGSVFFASPSTLTASLSVEASAHEEKLATCFARNLLMPQQLDVVVSASGIVNETLH